MLNSATVQPVMLSMIFSSIVIRLLLKFYYRDGERILPKLKLAPAEKGHISYYKRFDTLLAPLPFIYCWLETFAAVLFYRWTGYHPLAGLLLAIIAAGRFRALQEIGHNALHVALCRSKKLQWFLSNVFFQFPTLKRDMDSRFNTHVRDHHPNADIPGKDPNLRRVTAAGMKPGITRFQFLLALFYPVSPRGVLANIRGNLHDTLNENASVGTALLRAAATLTIMAVYGWLGGMMGLLVGWLLPVLTLYPLFAWWSLLSKHRWHTTYVPQRNRLAHDYEHGRATDFAGLAGIIQRYLIFPMSDAYHLAHHVYPNVRYQYLPAVDRALKINEPRYTQYISRGMIFGSDGQPAALSELYHRLVSPVRLPVTENETGTSHE
ncbi:fatty acid desaturase family protein [Pantoea ananatis]|uniref:fatty acid desaturase family protein n=1 Tax=Pantoea ananas TaxID=553 RepID=UPI0011A0F71F|nr:fatty acid desaturase [Pantoea ananatis]